MMDFKKFELFDCFPIGVAGAIFCHGISMSDQDQAEVRLILARLRQDHSDFDAAIEAMLKTGCDTLQIQRMKKKKLTLKDQMLRLEEQIIPDIIA
jgi:hypothetical protein